MAEISVHHDGPIIVRRAARNAGSPRYFTGRPCKHGHIAERWVHNGACAECVAINAAKWVLGDRERNPEKYRAYGRTAHEQHREAKLVRSREYQAENGEAIAVRKQAAYRLRDPVERRRSTLLRVYGIGLEEYDRMYIEQEGRCAICHAPHDVLAIDHCHRTSRIRGLLCSRCNSALGLFQDSAENLTRAIDYVRTGTMSVLTAAARNALPKLAFAGPDRSFPVNDRAHAADAKGRAKQALDAGHISKAEYDRVIAMADRMLGPKRAKLGSTA
jgi:hypothetical protein